MVVGKFGKILTFRTQASTGNGKIKVQTFSDFSRNVSSRVIAHNVISKKPKNQFNGPGLDNIECTIVFDAELGYKPRNQIKKLEECVQKGKTAYFIVGNKRVGKNKYVITSMSESWDEVITNGKLRKASVTITLEEYV